MRTLDRYLHTACLCFYFGRIAKSATANFWSELSTRFESIKHHYPRDRSGIAKELYCFVSRICLVKQGKNPYAIYRLAQPLFHRAFIELGYNPYKAVAHNFEETFKNDSEIIKLLTEPF